jgi:hypothetical protein
MSLPSRIEQAIADVRDWPAELLCCDHCGSLARDRWVKEEQVAVPNPAQEMVYPDILGVIPTLFNSRNPAAVTRTERLVATLMGQWGRVESNNASEAAARMVYLARCVERELDTPQTAEIQAPPWVNLSFADRTACKTWVLSVLDPALEKMEPEPMRVDLHPYRRHEFIEFLTEAFVWVLETHVVLEQPT